MIFEMQPFATFMNIENTRSYIDDLYSSDPDKCLASIICIKNSVIGSNRQKESVIAQGIVPRLLQLLGDKTGKLSVRIEAVVIINSLAKGTDDHIELLLNSGTVELLLEILEDEENRLIDGSLSCLRTLSQQEGCNFRKYSMKHIQRLLSLAGPYESFHRQICVANIIASACKDSCDQNILYQIGAPYILTSLLLVQNMSVRIPVVTCLASLCWNNPEIAKELANMPIKDSKMPNYLSNLICRYMPIEMQLEAARCLTNLYRAGAILAEDPIITRRTLPCLVRLCQLEHLEHHRAAAAETLAYLTEVDCDLQKIAAISNQLVNSLVNLLNSPNLIAQQASFRAFASLGANDEDIRKRIIDYKCLMERVVSGLENENKDIRLAAVRCLHSLSRSVQQLRTTFQDHSVWKPLMSMLLDDPSTELLTATSSALCNLLLDFSPAKEPMIQQGVISILASLTTRSESALRLNGVWALMNLAFQAEQRVKSQILNALGTDQIFRLLTDSDPKVLMKTLGLLRNLVSPSTHTDTMMALHGPQIMQCVVLVLEGPHLPEVKEQALCILGNIADGERSRDHIMSNEDVLKKLMDYLNHPAICLQETAVFCINNLSRRGELGYNERQMRLREIGVLNILEQMLETANQGLCTLVKTAHDQFIDEE